MRMNAHGRRLPRRPRPIAVNTLEIAAEGAAKMNQRDVNALLAVVQDAFKSMREGVGTLQHWSILAGTLDVSMAIERQGVVRGLREHLLTAEAALQSIYNRANSTRTWSPTALYFHELDAVREFVNLHAFQMRNLSRLEFEQVINTTTSQIRSGGGRATVVRELAGVAA
jgi:hypothetical protein